MTEQNQIQKPTSKELAGYVGNIAQRAGFHFGANEGSPIILLSSPDNYYWTISGELPSVYNGKKAKLRFETRDVNYINALGSSLDRVALFGGWDGERRFNDVEETLILPGLQIGCKRESYHYNSFWREKIGRQREDFGRYERNKEVADIRRMLEEAGKVVREQYPNLVGILDSPHYWARENYGQPIDNILNAELSLLKTEHSLPRKVARDLMRRLRRLFGEC